MLLAGIATLFSLVSCGLAWRANTRFRGVGRIPMQWSLSGDVVWSAPRLLGLAFLPATTIGLLAALTFLSLGVQPRVGQEGLELPVFIAVGVTVLAIQLLHLKLVERTLGRNGG